MPKRPPSHVLEDLSRTRLRQTFEQWGWTVQDLAKDYGEDLLVRIFKDGLTTPYSFFVQVKATQKLNIRKDGATSFGVRVEIGHVRHWIRFAEPVFLTLWDSSTDAIYWVCVQDALSETEKDQLNESRSRTMRVLVPLGNVLSDDGVRRIGGITKLKFKRLDREREVREILIEAIEKMGGKVEKVNPEDEVVGLRYPNGEFYYVVFGALAQLADILINKTGLSPEDCLHEALDLSYQKMLSGKLDARSFREQLARNIVDRERAAFEED